MERIGGYKKQGFYCLLAPGFYLVFGKLLFSIAGLRVLAGSKRNPSISNTNLPNIALAGVFLVRGEVCRDKRTGNYMLAGGFFKWSGMQIALRKHTSGETASKFSIGNVHVLCFSYTCVCLARLVSEQFVTQCLAESLRYI